MILGENGVHRLPRRPASGSRWAEARPGTADEAVKLAEEQVEKKGDSFVAEGETRRLRIDARAYRCRRVAATSSTRTRW